MTPFHYRNCLLAVFLWSACVAAVVLIAGCAVGRNDATGEIVLGFGAGRLVETANQAIATGTEGLLGTLGMAAGPAGAIGLLAARFYAKAESAKAAHEYETKGWESRERAGSVQLPLPPEAGPSPAPAVRST